MDLIDLGNAEKNGADFTEYLNTLCYQLELDYASYCAINTVSDTVQGFANYPVAWIEHYMGNGLQNIDPTIGVSARSIAPVDWSRFKGNAGFKDVFVNGRDFAITDRGLTVPIRGPYGECGLLIWEATRFCFDTNLLHSGKTRNSISYITSEVMIGAFEYA